MEFQEYLSAKYNFSINIWGLNYKQLTLIDVQKYYNNHKVKIDTNQPNTMYYYKLFIINTSSGAESHVLVGPINFKAVCGYR